MLKTLKIQNLILVSEAEIHFGDHFNVLTGETGAGKSAILSAIGLIMGDRTDTHLIGKHGDFALVEATFNNGLTIRREIDKSGKNKCFLNEKPSPLASLKSIIRPLIQRVDQSSSLLLFEVEEQRDILDTFADSKDIAKHLSESYLETQKLKQDLQEKQLAKETKARDLAIAEDDLSFIEEINWKPEEESTLYADHKKLNHSQDLTQKIETVLGILSESKLKQVHLLLDQCSRMDDSLQPLANTCKSFNIEMNELERTLASYLDRLDNSPHQLATIEQRIAKIEQLKKRFGKTYSEVLESQKKVIARIEQINLIDQECAELEELVQQKEKENDEIAETLSALRKNAALLLSSLVLKELSFLNLPNANFSISVKSQSLSKHGKDLIEFLFSANLGGTLTELKNAASGGELSRLLFSIKKVLAQKEKASCLIFDEIDGNVGGQTAAILGEKLKEIAKHKQVICITHFTQVARYASDHFLVFKKENVNLTISSIQKLQEHEKEEEYKRMLGFIKDSTHEP